MLNIVSPQVVLTEPDTGRMVNVWYRCFLSLFKQTIGSVQVPLNFPNTAAQTASNLTVPVTGAVDGDVVSLGVPNACVLANSCYTGWVSAVGIVTVRFNNYSAAAQDPPSGTFRVVVTRL
jgi:hypothetical protein